MPRVAQPASPSAHRGRPGRYRLLAVGILVLAGVWRALIAANIPCISRDSVMFCWYARDLGAQGLAYLREPTTAQHPLFPLTVLAAQRIARACGAPDTPMTWQISGQVVSFLAGMAVVALAGAITLRVVRRLELPIDAQLAGCCGMLLAALLPLNVWHSAEVMSDQLHAALYLLGVFALLKLEDWKAAVLCGLAAGLAFLTRPEGLVVVLAGLVVLAADRRALLRARAARACVLAACFLLCATPYWLTTGTLSAKKNPLNWLRSSDVAMQARGGHRLACDAGFRPADTGWVARGVGRGKHESDCDWRTASDGTFNSSGALLARLRMLDLSWYGEIWHALKQLMRAGRVVVPLLAVVPLINLRRQLLRPPLIGLTACLAGHLTLTSLLLHNYHYLDKRHMLIVILLLIPFAAILLARLLELSRQRRGGPAPAIAFGVFLLPLAVYSLRQPNYADRFLVDAACELAERDPGISSKLIMSGSSQRRIVFHTDARWEYWYEAPGDYDRLHQQILTAHPDYFIIETGPGFEREGNDRAVAKLRVDERLAPHRGELEPRPIPGGGELHVFTFDWAASPADGPPDAATGGMPADIERVARDKLPTVQAPAEIAHGQTPLRVRVLVLDFNPLIPGELHAPEDSKAQPKGLREVGGWNDPLKLAAGYMQDVCDASGGLIQYEIAEWLVVRRFQKKTDGFVYTPESYMACLRGGTTNNDTWHQPDGLDYPHMITEFNLIPRVESHEIDEVWMMGLPYFGYYESAMAGRGAFYVNGGVFDQVPCRRRFVIMGFNVERGVAEMLHDLCHRTEATMTRVYGGWQADQLTSDWARFAANQQQSGTAAVGTCHYPPNAEKDYDYANERYVESTADDWRHYPNLTGRRRRLNREEWGGPDYHRNYMKWWFAHLPNAPGVKEDGRLNSWWQYVFDFNAYDAQGRARPPAVQGQDATGTRSSYRRPR